MNFLALTVTENTIQYLRHRIIQGELPPGHRLNEMMLCSELNISSAPLREAFRLLQNEHMVFSIPRKGTFVAGVSVEDCRDIYKVREMIECFAVDLIRERNIRDLSGLESALASASNFAMPSSDNKEEMLSYQQAFVDFHEKLIETTGNQWAVRVYNSIRSNLARYIFIGAFVPNRSRDSLEEHKRILDLLKRRDYEQAKELIRFHINSLFNIIAPRIKKIHAKQ